MLGPVESISIEEMKRVFETNFFGVVRMIKEVMPDMKKRRSGHIVVMSSVMGLQGMICAYLTMQNKICIPVKSDLITQEKIFTIPTDHEKACFKTLQV